MSLFRTVPVSDWSTVDDRVWAHPGAIVDLGCDPWDWSAVFIGKKRVVGADPFAKQVPGTEVFNGVISDRTGIERISISGDSSNIVTPVGITLDVPMITWKQFKAQFNLTQIAILKINIEGSEYPLLKSMDDADFAEIDQIAVSFHHFVWPKLASDTADALMRLTDAGYTLTQTNILWGWYLCLH